jgi:methenyltetrahydrofolate cyclohydrolase
MREEARGGNYLDMPVSRFLDLLAGSEPAPSGGGAAALAVALAASLCAMTARLSASQMGAAEAGVLTTEAERIAAAAALLIQADADSYQGVLLARRQLRSGDAGQGRAEVAAALSAASEVPVQIAELAAAAARAAARLAAAGNPALHGDAIAGAVLAEAGARAAATLVGINLAGAPDDSRRARAARLAAEAASLAAATER